MAITFSDFFSRFGKAVDAYDKLLTATGTTLDTEFQQILDAFNSDSADIKKSIDGQIAIIKSFQSMSRTQIQSLLVPAMQSLITQYVIDDTGQEQTLDSALEVFIDQMIASSQTVQDSTISSSVSSVGTAYGDGLLFVSLKDSLGRSQENVFAENIDFQCASVTTSNSASFNVQSDISYDSIHHLYPNGSNLNSSVSTVDASSGLIPNSTMGTASTVDSNIPSGWQGFATATSSFTADKQDTIVISGTPTGGYYYIQVTDSQSRTYTTSALAYNAGQAAVQSAIASLPGFSSVSVTTTGTTPNYTHTIDYSGTPSPGSTTTTSNLTGGTPAIAVTALVSSSPSINGSKSLKITGNGSEQTTYYIPLSLSAASQYGYSFWLYPSTITSGVLEVSLVDDFAGSTVNDSQGTANLDSLNLSSLPNAAWYNWGGFFRTPETFDSNMYIKLTCSTAIDSSGILYIDSFWMSSVSEAYSGGPSFFITSGPTHWDTRDLRRVAVSNDYGGDVNQWLDKVFDLKGSGRKFPTASSPTILDSVIS
tara:strand:+ start:2145 stop:3752 length:1608 start_codon:yes stop_codon:yes gene_type:complete